MAQQRKVYVNPFSLEASQKYFKSTAPDVHFIFEEENETVKVPAHKTLLAMSSPVFDAMFNGELKEKGDVKIAEEKMQFRRHPLNAAGKRFWLTDIFFASVYSANRMTYTVAIKGNITIKRQNNSDVLFSADFGKASVEKHIRLPEPIEIVPDFVFEIIIKSLVHGYPNEISPQIKAASRFCPLQYIGPDYTLIERLHFEEESVIWINPEKLRIFPFFYFSIVHIVHIVHVQP